MNGNINRSEDKENNETESAAVHSIEYYEKEIVKQLKANGTYNRALGFQIKSLASAMHNLDMANRDIDNLTETTVYEETRYGSKLAPHPVFKIAKEAQELITRQMKALCLTVTDLGEDEAEDPLVELTKKVKNAGNKDKVIRRETTKTNE